MISFEEWCDSNSDVNPLIKKLKSSLPEQIIGFYLSKFLNIPIEYGKQFDWLGRYSIDMFFPTLDLAIEYDGVYFHKDRAANDIEKNELCKRNGVTVIRIREDGMKSSKKRIIILIPYTPNKNYTNIGDAINELGEKLHSKYGLKISDDIDIDRDRKEIIAYVQNKYYRNSMAYLWPEVFEYWGENLGVTPYDLFCSDNANFVCPHCGRTVHHFPKHFSKRKSFVPCECEYNGLDIELDKIKMQYKQTNEIIMLDDTFCSRRMYDRMVSDIRYFCEDNDELTMYKKMGFDLGRKTHIIKKQEL